MKSLIVAAFIIAFVGQIMVGESFVEVDGGTMDIDLVSGIDGREFQKTVDVETFLLSRTELTVVQWRQFTDETGYAFPWEDHYIGDIAVLSPDETCPIQLVRINEAVWYCNWRSRQDGLEPVYIRSGDRIVRNPDADGYRIPTTDEWDFAARGGTSSKRTVYAGADDPEVVAWFGMNFEDGTRPVGGKAPNEIGLYDMTGNIREWTWPPDGIPLDCRGSRDLIPIRGGSWVTPLKHLGLEQDDMAYAMSQSNIGFRLARNAE